MIRIEFNQENIDALKYWADYHQHPHVRKKMRVLYLKAQNLPHKEIMRLEQISENTLLAYLREYLSAGISGLMDIKFNKPKSELDNYAEELTEYFKNNPPATRNEAREVIEKLTHIKRTPQRVGEFLKKLGFKKRKTGAIPARADTQKQEAFLTDELKPRIAEAIEGKRVLLFIDAAHFVLSSYLGYLWSLTRLFIKSPSGRQRYNVLGALNPITLDLITISNDTYINSETVCELLNQIALLSFSAPVTLVLDNARYQRCYLVTELAQKLGLELLFLPPYSPNLNLIERLWKFVKNKCLYCYYYDSFKSFKNAINNCLSSLNSDYKPELQSLLTLNFQIIRYVHVTAL